MVRVILPHARAPPAPTPILGQRHNLATMWRSTRFATTLLRYGHSTPSILYVPKGVSLDSQVNQRATTIETVKKVSGTLNAAKAQPILHLWRGPDIFFNPRLGRDPFDIAIVFQVATHYGPR